jgi:hypothetical protein
MRAVAGGFAVTRLHGALFAIPPASLAGRQDRLVDGRLGIDIPAGVWLREDVREMTIFADQYDFAVSLLMLADDPPPIWHDEETEEDVYDHFTARS